MQRKPKPKPIRVTIRMKADMHREIDRIAQRDRRPVNTQLLMLIERGLAA